MLTSKKTLNLSFSLRLSDAGSALKLKGKLLYNAVSFRAEKNDMKSVVNS